MREFTSELRVTGHETFPCRTTWLPKAACAILEASDALANDERAMADLGLGKNMVSALRFWVEVCGVARRTEGRNYALTDFGRAIFGPKGYDPYLEDPKTLWLVHWQIATQQHMRPFAWDFLLNEWHRPELCRSEVVEAFSRRAQLPGRKLSPVTLKQHFEVFIRSYVPRQGSVPQSEIEDVLDCPLTDLRLIERVGQRRTDSTIEPVFAFRRGPHKDLNPALFAYCLNAFWEMHWPGESTLSQREIATGHGSPGQVLKLGEDNLRDRLQKLGDDTEGVFIYKPSSVQPQVVRGKRPTPDFLQAVFDT